MWLGWNPAVLDVVKISESDQMLLCRVHCLQYNFSCLISVVYASNDMVSRRQLWSSLCSAAFLAAGTPWTAIGDFNTVLSPDENVGGAGTS